MAPFDRSEAGMDISNVILSYLKMNIHSEAEVRSKLIVPLLELLGYSALQRGEEFPVYGYEGGLKLQTKYADFIQFSSANFTAHTSESETDLRWVHEHSLLVFEAKNVTQNFKGKEQAQFYAAWTKSPAYIISNGKVIEGYITNANYTDYCCFSCEIKDIPENWPRICSLNYENVIRLKNEAQDRFDLPEENIYKRYLDAMRARCKEKLQYHIDRKFSLETPNDFELDEGKKTVNIAQLLDDDRNKVITAEPGGGKSYLMWMIMELLLRNPSEEQFKIPVILEGRYYGKTYHSIEEGIYNLLRRYCDNMSKEYIGAQLQNGRFIILFDAVDEVEIDFETLQGEIYDLAYNTDCLIYLTFRSQNYELESFSNFDHYVLEPLTDQDLSETFDLLSEHGIYLNSDQIPERLREILRNPLFLKLFVNATRKEEINAIPKNQAALFELYIEENLNRLRYSVYEKEIIKRILSEYAEFYYEFGESTKEFVDIINNYVPEGYEEKYSVNIWKAGLICQGDQGVCFTHRTFAEFFYAYKLSQLNEDEILKWLEEKNADQKYVEIICLLTGIISNRSKQNLVLDYLETSNISLYIKALKARRNFRIDQKQLNDNYVEAYFEQLLKSYAALVETYFYRVKICFDGYNREDKILYVAGNMDLESGNISVFIDRWNEKNHLKVTGLSDAGAKLINGEGKEISIQSFVFPYGKSHQRGYNLQLLGYGFDSSREIALDIVKVQIIDILKQKKVFDDLFPVLLCEDIEQQLRHLRNGIGMGTACGELSLYSHSVQTIISTLQNDTMLFEGKESLIEQCRKLSILTKNPTDYLDVPGDLERKGSFTYAQLYSDEQLLKRIKNIALLEHEVMQEIVTREIPVLNVTEHSCRVIGVVCRDGQNALFQYIKVLCAKNEDTEPIIMFSDRKIETSFNQVDEFFVAQLRALGKSDSNIIGKGSSILIYHYGEDVFHKHIYKAIKDRINQSIFTS